MVVAEGAGGAPPPSGEGVTRPFVNRKECIPQVEKSWPIFGMGLPAFQDDTINLWGATVGARETVAPSNLLDGLLIGHP